MQKASSNTDIKQSALNPTFPVPVDDLRFDVLNPRFVDFSDSDENAIIDPPYTAAGKKAGKRLYTHNELDHEALFAVADTLQGDFLMTYDNADGVRALAERHNFDVEAIAMKNTHHAEMTELLISRNLDWVRRSEK